MSFVLDNSATLAFLLPDEIRPEYEDMIARIVREGAVAPGLWQVEITQTLTTAMRRGRITAAQRAGMLADLMTLPIVVETTAIDWRRLIAVADQWNLTAYDAAYLEMAARRMLPLATLDRELREAAQGLHVPLLPEAVPDSE